MNRFITLLFVTLISFLIINSCGDIICSENEELPSIVITSHSDADTVSGIVKIQCELSENINILQTELWVNGYFKIFADTSQQLVLNWYTKYLTDGPYDIEIKILDSDSIQYFSDPMTLIVDNSMYRPNPVNILSVTYNQTEMKVTWNKSDAIDFSHYSIHHYVPGPSQHIPNIYSINDTTATITDFNPAVENWFGVIVHDTTFYQSSEERLANEIEQPPNIPILNNVLYENSSFNISWGKNNEDDFLFYVLYESSSSQMKHKHIAYSSTNPDDTTFTINVGLDEFRFYQVNVVDYWNLSSKSNIRFTSSYPKIAFVSTRDGISNIFKMDSDGTNVINLTNSDDKESYPKPIPNSEKILYLKTVWGSNGLHDELFVMNNNGADQTQLTNDSRYIDTKPVISNDGSKIVYADDNSLYVIDVNTFERNTIFTAYNDITSIDISPNNEKLVFVMFMSNDAFQVNTINIDGSNSTTVKYVRGYSHDPIYFVDDNKIIYEYSTFDSSRVYIMNSDGTNTINLTPDYPKNQLANISDDKTRLIVRSGISGHLDTRIINIDGTVVNNLNMSTYYKPYFSSNNKKIVFYNSDWYNNEGHHNIYLIDADGSNRIKLTEDNTYDLQPIFMYH